MAFMERNNIELFYKKLIHKFKEEKYKSFFFYFKRNWMDTKISNKNMEFL